MLFRSSEQGELIMKDKVQKPNFEANEVQSKLKLNEEDISMTKKPSHICQA